MAEFHLWSKENLVEFANEATAQLQEQAAQIAQLQGDIKTAMLGWRNAVRESEQNTTPRESST